MSTNSPFHTKHLVTSPPDLPVLRLLNVYATHEQLRLHADVHSSNVLLSPPTEENMSGDFIPGKAKKPSLHRGAFFLRHPAENLPTVHSSVLVGSKPSRHLHAGTAGVVDVFF